MQLGIAHAAVEALFRQDGDFGRDIDLLQSADPERALAQFLHAVGQTRFPQVPTVIEGAAADFFQVLGKGDEGQLQIALKNAFRYFLYAFRDHDPCLVETAVKSGEHAVFYCKWRGNAKRRDLRAETGGEDEALHALTRDRDGHAHFFFRQTDVYAAEMKMIPVAAGQDQLSRQTLRPVGFVKGRRL